MNNKVSSVAKWVSIMYRYGQCYICKRLDTYNIGSGQFIFLLALYKNDGISQEKISNDLRIDKATTAKAIKKLEDEGYVRRERDLLDKRAYKVYITQKARDIESEVMSVMRSWNQTLSSGLSEDEKETLLILLKKIEDSVFKNSDVKHRDETER